MKRTIDSEQELPVLPTDIINTIHQNYLEFTSSFETLLNWHATQKSFYKEWVDLEYMTVLVKKVYDRISEKYQCIPHGLTLLDLHKLKLVHKSLSVIKSIKAALPKIDFALKIDCTPESPYIIFTKGRKGNLVYLFDYAAQVDETKKTPLTPGKCDVLFLVQKYMKLFLSWEIMLGTENNESVPMIGPKFKNVFLESYITVRIYKNE